MRIPAPVQNAPRLKRSMSRCWARMRFPSCWMPFPMHHRSTSLIVQLALLIGARRGEICALRWSDIDLEKGTISINRTVQFIPGTGLVFNPPKTKRSRRCIRIGSDCVELLREYQRYQKAERFRIGSAWVRKVTLENGKVVDNDMLFTKWDGEPMDPDIISTWFPKFLTEHGLPQVHFHSLRHPYVKPKTKKFITFFEVFGQLHSCP